MRMLGLAVLLSVNLGGGFGEASAEIKTIDEKSMNILITVEVETSAESVVAHLVAPGEPELTLPLLPGGNGRFEIQTDLRPVDYQVVFEVIGPENNISDSVSLSALGAEFPSTPPRDAGDDEEGLSAETKRLGWLALALAAASLSALAFWALGGRDEGDDPDRGDDDENSRPDDVETSQQIDG